MSNPNTVDDLLSFKEYEPDNYSRGASSGRAEININSPKREFVSHFDDSTMADEMSISIDDARPGSSGGGGRMQQQELPQQSSGGKEKGYIVFALDVK